MSSFVGDLELVRRKFSHCSHSLQRLDRLLEGADRIRGYCHEYDYRPEESGNGHRSFVLIIERLVTLLASDQVDQDDGDQLVRLNKRMDILFSTLLDIESLRETSPNGQHFCRDVTFNTDLLKLSLRINDDLKYMFGRNSNFWLCPSMQTWLHRFYMTLVTGFWEPWSAHRVLWDADHVPRTFADFAQNAQHAFVHRVWNLSEVWFYKTLAPLILYRWRMTIRTLFVDAPTSWTISTDNELNLRQSKKIRQVRCRYLMKRLDPENDVLVLYVHGAGFVAQHPDSHETFLCDWALKMDTVPILSVDYSWSPKARHPVALQEILDIYLFLTGSSPDVLATLGFRPQRIVLLGDSAGATLCLSLTMALNDIRRIVLSSAAHESERLPPLPMTIVAMYPCTNMNYEASASKLFSAFDTFLPTGVVLELSQAYVPLASDEGSIFAIKEDKSIPWYRQSNVMSEFRRLGTHTAHPYLSPLYYEHFEDLESVHLCLICPQFDALLDDSVALARAWRGQVTLDILKDLPHGFNYFLLVSADAKRAADHCARRLVQVVKSH